MSVDLSPAPRTISLKPQRRSSSPNPSKRRSSRPTFPRGPSISFNASPHSYLIELEYPEERKRSFANSARTKITLTEQFADVMTSSTSDHVGRPGKKPKLNDNNKNADLDHNNPSPIGDAAGDTLSGDPHTYPTSNERTNWWDDDDEEVTACDSLKSSSDDKKVEDQVECPSIDVPRGRPTSTPSLVVTSISRRSRSADSPPLSPETPQHGLLEEASTSVENPFASPADDFVDDEGFKTPQPPQAYFDMTEASSNSSNDDSAWSSRRSRKRSKSLTPPTSPPTFKPYDLIYSSPDETENFDVQIDLRDYSTIQLGAEEEELLLMEVEFPSIYSPDDSPANGNFFKFGSAETIEPLGLGLIAHGRPANASPYSSHPNFGNVADVSTIQHSSVQLPVAGMGGDRSADDANVADINIVLEEDVFEEVLEEVDEGNDLLRAQWELVRRGLYFHSHIDRFHARMNGYGGNPPDRNAPRPYSPLGFYPPLPASGLPAYLHLKELEEEAKEEVESPKATSETRSATAVSPSWSDLDGDENDDYFKELPLF
ncbi:hypothetical protein FS837_009841 [Tulasnella sp. UAMH 9824]|nr:hypothetical protein FS837_009841 [Tulasnella sp. UAMH 9824]